MPIYPPALTLLWWIFCRPLKLRRFLATKSMSDIGLRYDPSLIETLWQTRLAEPSAWIHRSSNVLSLGVILTMWPVLIQVECWTRGYLGRLGLILLFGALCACLIGLVYGVCLALVLMIGAGLSATL